MSRNAVAAGEVGNDSVKDFPASQDFIKLGSMGNLPKKGTLNFAAIPIGVLSEDTFGTLNSGLWRKMSCKSGLDACILI